MGPMPEPPFGWDEVDEHPGQQCHEAHPDRAHRQPAPPPRDYAPIPGPRFTMPDPVAPREGGDVGGASVDQATALVLLGSDPWSRFDLWAQRAWELAERAIDAAKDEGERNAGLQLSEEVRYDPRAQNLLDAARLCSDLAQAVCPLGALAGLPGRLPDLELELPPILG